MSMFPDEKIGLFVDGANMHATSKMLDVQFDYMKLKNVFMRRGNLITFNYYTAVHTDDNGDIGIQKLMDWLEYNSITLVQKPAKSFSSDVGVTRIKGNMDIEMSVDIMELIETIEHFYLFTGDGDFVYLLRAIKRRGRKVTVVSTKGMVADELRRTTTVIDLKELVEEIKRVF